MRSFFCFAILVTCQLVGCKDEKKIENENQVVHNFRQLADSVFAQGQQKKPLAYVILPNSGCGGCISSAEQLVVKYGKKTADVNFIFTSISSVKNLRMTFGDSVINGNNVFLDRNNLFYGRLTELNRMYPILFYYNSKSGGLMYKYISPENLNSIPDFEKYLAQKMPAL